MNLRRKLGKVENERDTIARKVINLILPEFIPLWRKYNFCLYKGIHWDVVDDDSSKYHHYSRSFNSYSYIFDQYKGESCIVIEQRTNTGTNDRMEFPLRFVHLHDEDTIVIDPELYNWVEKDLRDALDQGLKQALAANIQFEEAAGKADCGFLIQPGSWDPQKDPWLTTDGKGKLRGVGSKAKSDLTVEEITDRWRYKKP